MNINRVVIWGHKGTGSHSFIHAGYFKSFKYLGYETYWVSDISELNGIDLSNTLFLTEDQAKRGMPIRSDCYYILHHIDNTPYLNCKIVNLCNYVHYPLKKGESFNYPGSQVEKVKDHVYYDKSNKAIYQPWATDLLPTEISDTPIEYNKSIKEINFIGSIWDENIVQIHPMLEDLLNKGINVNIHGWLAVNQILRMPNIKHISSCGGSDDNQAKKLIQSSLFYPDIRGEHHKNVGYIPCRLFKNISYGCIPCTNSLPAYEFFGGKIPYSENTKDFLDISTKYLENRNIEDDKNLMNFIKTEHTYVNRIEELIKYFDILYS